MSDPLMEIIVARLDEEPPPGQAAPRASLSAAERERAARLRLPEDRRRFIVSHAKLRQLLGERCGVSPGALRIECGPHGKPAVAGSSVQFSMARSRGLAAYAFARGQRVGIDVEAVRPFAQADEIAARIFPREEWRAYCALPARLRAEGFFRGWTRTESLAKALGDGLGHSPERLDAAIDGGWEVCSFAPAPGFAGAVAYERGGARR